MIADLSRRKGDPVYKPSPAIDLIFGADDHLIGIAIHGDEALGLLDLLHQIIDCHGVVPLAVDREGIISLGRRALTYPTRNAALQLPEQAVA
jgi:hypothetical protein